MRSRDDGPSKDQPQPAPLKVIFTVSEASAEASAITNLPFPELDFIELRGIGEGVCRALP
jgi:hypothetical protein